MPLSEHERRQLEQIEQALRADDPRFADAVRAADPRVRYKRRVIAAALGLLTGVGLLAISIATWSGAEDLAKTIAAGAAVAYCLWSAGLGWALWGYERPAMAGDKMTRPSFGWSSPGPS